MRINNRAVPLLLCLLSSSFYFVHGVRRTPSSVRNKDENDNEMLSSFLSEYDNKERHLRSQQQQRRRTLLETVEETTTQQQQPPRSPEDHLIRNLPLLDEIPTPMFAGHLPASPNDDKKFFYWLVAPENEDDRASAPLLIWLNGGPGCSSMEGLFLENGPIKFVITESSNGEPKWKLQANPYSWHLAPAWVLYIDQPVGTGLSFTKSGNYCKNDNEVNTDFFYFLEEFFLIYHNEFLQDGGQGQQQQQPPQLNRPLYMSGESHAGHYIPSMIEYNLSKRNGNNNSDSGNGGNTGGGVRVDITITGAAIGNGWIDPYNQYSVSDAAYGAGLINFSQRSHLDDVESQCQELLQQNKYNSNICFDLLDLVTHQSFGSTSQSSVSQYDITKIESKSQGQNDFPKGHKLVDSYLGGVGKPTDAIWDVNDYKDVLVSLHATESYLDANQHYKGCTDPPYYALAWADGLGVTEELTTVLNHPSNIRMLFYNGMNDLICNHVGNEVTLSKLDNYIHAEEWRMAKRYTWHVDTNDNNDVVSALPISAFVQESYNLSFLKIPNSGHMVPMDLPNISLQMIHTFIYNKSFQDSPQELERDDPTKKSCEKVQR